MGLSSIYTVEVTPTMTLLLTCFVALALIKIAACIFAQRRRWNKLPPGPRGWPIIGVVPMILRAERQGIHTHTLMTTLSQQYGTVFSFKLGMKLIVSLQTTDAIKEAFNNVDISDRESTLLDTISDISGKGIITSSGQVWLHHRRFLCTVLRNFDVGKPIFEEKIVNEASFLADAVAKYNGQPTSLVRLFANAAANTICTLLLGKHYDYDDEEFQELLKHIDIIMKFIGAGGKGFFLPPFVVKNILYKQEYQDYFKSFKAVHCILGNIITEHQKHDITEDSVQDFVDAYLLEIAKSSQKAEESFFTIKNLKGNMGDLILAGLDTTMNTLLWAFLYMITYPDIQKRIQDELDSAFGRSILPRKSDIAKLPFTEATLLEVQRIQTVFPMGGQHSTSKDTTIKGFDIPKGTVVLSNLWHVHHDPDIWGDPEEFRPERFLDDSGKVVVSPHYIPFSTGRRACIGEKIAKSELFYFFTHLLHRFNFSRPANAPLTPFAGLPGLSYGPPDFEALVVSRD